MWELRTAWPLLLASSLLGSCEPRKSEVLSVASASEPSPNASVLPAPLATAPTKQSAKDNAHPPAEPSSDVRAPEPPRPLRDDDVLPPESELRAAPGLSLEGRLRWLEAPPPRSPEANNEALARARDKTALEVRIDASSLGRLRFVLASHAFPFPTGTELRARDDRFGHVLVWPGAAAYTPLPSGTLRAVLSEARVDASPLSEPSVLLGGPGNLLGIPTQKLRLETSLGKLELEQAALPIAGSSGALLCRLLLELLSIGPESAACRPEHVPLRAEYTWPSGARFEVEVTKLTKRPELPADSLATPPSTASLRRGELPSVPFVVLVEERDLGELHARALPPPAKLDPTAPKLGLVFQNRSDVPRYLLVDGVPVVWLRADAEWLVAGLKQGRYNVQTRDFFGAETSPTRLLELPARYQVGDDASR
jgi:hypothetical protein